MLTRAEENYLKTIYHLEGDKPQEVNTTAIAEAMENKPSSVTDMVQRLSDKNLATYKRYRGVRLTARGRKIATGVIRKHRLWEVFLVEKLHFEWDQVHDIAEQLEHVQSDELVRRLDDYLGNPEFDPHGDPIPNADGIMARTEKKLLSDATPEQMGVCVGVKESSADFLQYLDRLKINIGTKIKVVAKESFDDSVLIEVDGVLLSLSGKVAENLFLKLI
ncbi:MAG TPA: metal-dependent transcriptional regulator [Flavobacteriaceae bacterium]|nr:metal-dependent transcriptional regulator [Flavobacteriaceae bacterium]